MIDSPAECPDVGEVLQKCLQRSDLGAIRVRMLLPLRTASLKSPAEPRSPVADSVLKSGFPESYLYQFRLRGDFAHENAQSFCSDARLYRTCCYDGVFCFFGDGCAATQFRIYLPCANSCFARRRQNF